MKGLLMIRSFISGLTIIFLLLLTGSSNGQVTADIKSTIAKKFITYCNEVPRQEIFVHTDRESFIAGEDMWFSIYLFDRKTNSLQADEKIAYIEILNPENRPVVQKRILMVKGVGQGQISLPDTLSSGTYTLRAYTNWMKNFMPDNCYMQELRVYNAFRSKAFMFKSYMDQESAKGTVNKLTEPSENYLLLNVNNLIPEHLEIEVSTDSLYRSDNNNIFYLFIQTHGNIDNFTTERILSEKTVISFPRRLLTPGINHITIFDAAGHALKERLIYTPANPAREITLSTVSSFKTREKITIGLELPESIADELSGGNLSVSVIPEKAGISIIKFPDYMLFGSEFGITPLSFLKTGSISGMSPARIDSLLLTLRSNWIDWGKILSGKITYLKYKPETEYHYLSGRLIKKVSQTSDSGKYVYMSVPGKVARFQYTKTDNESGFSMKVRIDDRIKDFVIQPGDPENISSTKIESSFSDKYIPSVPYYSEANTGEAPAEVNRMSSNYQVNKIYSTTSLGMPVSKLFVPETKQVRFYGRPDVGLIMADYIKLPVMEEVFFELIPGATLKRKKTGYEITVFDPVNNKVYDVPPCIMVDGVIIYNPAVIAGIDPELVERIDVVKDKYYVGDNLFYGIINIITRSGDFSSVTLPDYATRMQYKVYEPPLSFISPDYSSFDRQLSRVPDFRNTLFWNPRLKTDKTGKAAIEFWSCDIRSNYVISVQGVTSNGDIVSLKSVIRVE